MDKVPNPETTAKGIVAALQKFAPMTQSEEGQREMKKELGRARQDALQEAYRFERDLKRAGIEQAVEAAAKNPMEMINAAKEAVSDSRMFEHIAEEMREEGGMSSVKGEELQKFA